MIRLLRGITNKIAALPLGGGIRDAICRLTACTFGGGGGSRPSQDLFSLEPTVSDSGTRSKIEGDMLRPDILNEHAIGSAASGCIAHEHKAMSLSQF